MRTPFTKRWIAALLAAACLFVLLACKLPLLIPKQVGVKGTPTPGQQVTIQSTTGTEHPLGIQATGEPVPGDVTFGPGSFNLMDPAVGLSDLASYKATLTLSFNGNEAGKPSVWSYSYVMLSNKQLAAHQITIKAAAGDPPPFIKTEANGVSYEISKEGDCTASTTAPGASLTTVWEPAGFLSSVIGADASGSETINGMSAGKYTFDERAIGETGFTKSTGQIWVASKNGVVLRYLLTTTAGADYFGEGIEGSQTWEYNLAEIDQPVTINPPTGCPGGLVDAPLMPGAQNVRQLPEITIYSIEGAIQDVLAFYQKQMPALGWTNNLEPGLSETMGTVNFVQGDQQLTVIVTSSGNMVVIRLVKGTVPNPDAKP